MFYAIKSPRARRTPEYVPVITPDVGLLNLVVYSHSGTQPGLCCAVPDVLMFSGIFSSTVCCSRNTGESAGGLLHPAAVSYGEVGGGSELYITSSLYYNTSKRDIGDIQDNFSFSPINL